LWSIAGIGIVLNHYRDLLRPRLQLFVLNPRSVCRFMKQRVTA